MLNEYLQVTTHMAPRKRVLCLPGSVIKCLYSATLVFLLVYVWICDDLVMEMNKWLFPCFLDFIYTNFLAACLAAGQGEHNAGTSACVLSWGCPWGPTLLAVLPGARGHLCCSQIPPPGAGIPDSVQRLSGTQSKAGAATWLLQEMPVIGNRRV